MKENSIDELLAELHEVRSKGDYLRAYDIACAGVERYPDNMALKFQAVLALARTEALDAAQELYQQWGLDSIDNEDYQALAGRLAKDRALLLSGPERQQAFIVAADKYAAVFARTQGYFPAINVATMSLLGGAIDKAQIIAKQTLDILDQIDSHAGPKDYYQTATRAEALLILGDHTAARTAVIDAAAARGSDWAKGAATRKQLILVCTEMAIDLAILAPLKPPAAAHFCGHIISTNQYGRFPVQEEKRVRAELERLVSEQNIHFGFGSGASGADLIIAEILMELGREVSLVLPFDRQEFIEVSVLPAGTPWLERFEKVCRYAENSGGLFQITPGAYLGDDDLFVFASHYAMGLAVLRAKQLGSDCVQLAVWDGVDTGPGAGSGGDIHLWQSQGYTSHIVDSAANMLSENQAQGHSPVLVDKNNDPEAAPKRSLKAMLFGDIKGFTRVTEAQMGDFQSKVMGGLGRVLDQLGDDVLFRNTWGDAVYLVFPNVATATKAALMMQEAMADIKKSVPEMPDDLALRLGAHFGPIYQGEDEVLKSIAYFGTEVSRTARIEPITPPGEVYATEAYATALALDAGSEYKADYVGLIPSAKEYGTFRMYHIRRVGR